ncbi:MAG: NAD(P)-dependent oxidoreductase [Eubacteriales bacterium]|nr:NAD(P)-dependent oxidoreductase [Eubacteriales bacterium]
MQKVKILLTGATGSMGKEGLIELYKCKDMYDIVLLARPSEKNIKSLKKYENDKSVSIVWGDLTNYNDVLKAVEQVDIVLHVAAFVSPEADRNPKIAWKINYGGTKNIVDAICSLQKTKDIKLVYIGTVAETGNRPVPVHWGRVGDPILPSAYDYYAVSKIAAERLVIESSIKQWVSLRQTGILHHGIMGVDDGIGYHQPINNHLEWITSHDSGVLLANVCRNGIPEDFWGNVYNIGGGAACRATAYEFTTKLYGLLGVDFKKISEPNWYALRNFHGQFYLDSDKLNDYLDFRSEGLDDFVEQMKKKLPFSSKILKFMPLNYVKENVMKKTAMSENSPLYWLEHNIEGKIAAFFGTKEKWKEIKDWEHFEIIKDPPHIVLDHGYDENKNDSDLDLADVQAAAKFRGGQCTSVKMNKGDLSAKLEFKCACGHEFEASPKLILKTGHWCEECSAAPWRYDEIAKTNPFIAQVYYADHEKNENNIYE